MRLGPQPGPQSAFFRSPADILIYGGGAGAGKTWSVLSEPLRHIRNPDFNAVFFRRTSPQITNPGGLWDASLKLYPLFGAIPKQSYLKWVFPSGCHFVMRHLKLERNVLDWQGTELVYVGIDEITHFTPYQFWYIMSRLRSTSGIRPYLRGTCNPDADSHIRELLDWWIGDDGTPNLRRAGRIRHLQRVDGEIRWYPYPQYDSDGRVATRSLTFIPATIYDNPRLLQEDPNYLSNLKALPRVDRDRLLGGNWNVKAVSGKVFRRDWLSIIPCPPAGQPLRKVRFWDFAATLQKVVGSDPDWTVGTLFWQYENVIIWMDTFRDRLVPHEVDRAIANLASQDGMDCAVRWWSDPGQAGIYQSSSLGKLLSGYDRHGVSSKLDKVTRAKPLSRAIEFQEVVMLAGDWNSVAQNELVQFPDGDHDDQVDAAAGAYVELTGEGLAKFTQTKYS